MEQTLTTKDAASEVGLKRVTIIKHIRTGNLPANKHGRDWVILRSEFEKWRQERTYLVRQKIGDDVEHEPAETTAGVVPAGERKQ